MPSHSRNFWRSLPFPIGSPTKRILRMERSHAEKPWRMSIQWWIGFLLLVNVNRIAIGDKSVQFVLNVMTLPLEFKVQETMVNKCSKKCPMIQQWGWKRTSFWKEERTFLQPRERKYRCVSERGHTSHFVWSIRFFFRVLFLLSVCADAWQTFRGWMKSYPGNKVKLIGKNNRLSVHRQESKPGNGTRYWLL